MCFLFCTSRLQTLFIIFIWSYLSASVSPGKAGRDYFQSGLINRVNQGRKGEQWSKEHKYGK